MGFDSQANQAQEYEELGHKILDDDAAVIPKPLAMDELDSTVRKYGLCD